MEAEEGSGPSVQPFSPVSKSATREPAEEEAEEQAEAEAEAEAVSRYDLSIT